MIFKVPTTIRENHNLNCKRIEFSVRLKKMPEAMRALAC